MSAITDHALMTSYAETGRPELLAELRARHCRNLVTYVSKFFDEDMDRAEDVVQATFMAIQEDPGSYTADKPFAPWLYSTATSIAFNLIRSKSQPIAQLESGDWDSIKAVFGEGLSHRAAAEALGIPLGSLKTRLRRALQFIEWNVGTVQGI